MRGGEDTLYMHRALELARMGRLGASPNPMVGAVVVAAGRVIGEGFHARCGGPHAEVRAMNSVAEADRHLIEGSTVYVTLEPCAHYGKTPPCASMLVEKRVGRVVVGCIDPFAKVAGRGVEILRQAGIDVTVGVLEDECRWINRRFFTAHTLRRPYITLKWACSCDGWLDVERTPGHPQAARFSSELTRLEVMRLRAENDAVAVGSGTVIADDPTLNVRGLAGRQPLRVVLDRRGRIEKSCEKTWKVMTDGDEPALVVTDRMCLSELLERLYSEHGITSILVEGGAEILKSFIADGLWDEVRREMAPFELGSSGRVKAPELPEGIMRVRIDDSRVITHVYHRNRLF